MKRIRRWACGLWRYLRGLGYRRPQHKRPRSDRDDSYLPSFGDYLTAPLAPVSVIDRDAASESVAYWAREAWRAIDAEGASYDCAWPGHQDPRCPAAPAVAELLDRPYAETDDPERHAWADPAAVGRWIGTGWIADAWWIRRSAAGMAAAPSLVAA